MRDKLKPTTSNLVRDYFFETYLYIYISCGVLAVFISSYGGYKLSQILSHPIIDNGCTGNIPGVGQHCWGDFSGPLVFASSQQPWSGRINPYPPLATLLFKPFAYLSNNVDVPNLSLVLFLILSLAAVTYPPLHLYVTKQINQRQLIQGLILMISSAPVLVALDRGNFLLLLVPLIYHTIMAGIFFNSSFAVLVSILGCFRPQFFILLLILIANGQLKRFLSSTLMAGSMFVLSFLVYPSQIIQNLDAYFGTLMKYQDYQFVGVPWPVNISLNNTIMTIYRGSIEIFSPDKARALEGTWTFLPSVLVYGSLLALLVLRYRKIKTLSSFEKLFLFLSLSVVIPNVSFTYYLIYIPIMILLPALRVNSPQPYFSNIINQRFFFTTSILILVNFSIPWSLIPPLSNEGWSDVAMNWIFGQVFLLLTVLVFTLGRNRVPDAR